MCIYLHSVLSDIPEPVSELDLSLSLQLIPDTIPQLLL